MKHKPNGDKTRTRMERDRALRALSRVMANMKVGGGPASEAPE